MGTGETSDNSGRDVPDNVIRFPRDWFGSTDDLIPIGSAADRLEEEAAATERERTSAPSADDFWGEGSSALHQPVDVPRSDAAPAAALRVDPPARAEVVASSPRRRSVHMPRLGRPGVVRLTSPPPPAVRVPRAALLLAALLIGAVGLFLAGALGTSGTTSRPVTHQAAEAVGVAEAPQVRSVQATLLVGGQDAALAASRVKAPRARVHRHLTRKAGASKASTRHTTKTHRETPAKGSTPAPVSPDLGVTPAANTDSASSGSDVSQAPSAATAAGRSSAAASDSHRTTSSTAADASGPAGLGSVVGSDCDPKCTR